MERYTLNLRGAIAQIKRTTLGTRNLSQKRYRIACQKDCQNTRRHMRGNKSRHMLAQCSIQWQHMLPPCPAGSKTAARQQEKNSGLRN